MEVLDHLDLMETVFGMDPELVMEMVVVEEEEEDLVVMVGEMEMVEAMEMVVEEELEV